MRRYALRDDQWDRIRDLLSGRLGSVGVTAKDNRLFVEGSCTATGPASLGATCPSASGMRSRCSAASAAGRSLASGSGCSGTSAQRPTTNTR